MVDVTTTPIPMPQSPVVDLRTGYASMEWYRFWNQPSLQSVNYPGKISTSDDVPEGVNNLYFTSLRAQNAVANLLQNSPTITFTYIAGNSITASLNMLSDNGVGSLLAVSRDAWGRMAGTRSATLTTASSSRITIVNPDASTGLPTFDLATVTDIGGGTLQKTAFDAWGRKTGTSAATTDNLTEGSTNLYFTAARVLATVLTGLSTATNAVITATDTVLSALGKLQSQISANLTTLGTKADKSITLTAGMGLTGGGDLSANRTFAIANTAVTAASYGDTTHVATFTVNAQGQLTLAGSSAIAFPVTSVFGRTGAVVAAANDYTFAQLASKPTTLAGYGITDALATITPAGYIDGLKMVWNSATSISATSGTCYIQGSSAVISFPSLLTLSSMSLTASTFYHLYGYLNSGTPAIELVTTAPAASYSGTARSKTGDTSRRYLGSVLTDASGNIYNFQHSGDAIKYDSNINASPFIVLNAGRATTATVVSVSGVSPITSKTTSLLILNSDTVGAQIVYFSNAQLGSATTTSYLGFCFYGSTEVMDFPTGTSQNLNYIFGATPTGACFIRVSGYLYER